jgi:hypothetical protein
LHVDIENSGPHPASDLQDEIKNLSYKLVPYPAYSPGLAIIDFCLFGKIEEEL